MRKLLIVCWVWLSGMASLAHAGQWLVLSNFHLIDGTGAPMRHVDQLIIQNGVITAVGGDTSFEPQAADIVTRIDLNGAWIMPGLVDTHVHVARFPENNLQMAQDILRQAVRGGVTAVRDLGGDARTLAEINRALHYREWTGPALVYSAVYGGPSLFADPRISRLAGGFGPGGAPWTQAVTAQTDLPLAIAASRGAGAGGIKLYGNLDVQLSQLIIDAAGRQNLPVWAHATVFPAGPQELVEAGVSSLSHAAYLVWAAADHIPDDYSARTDGPWGDIPADHPKLLALFAAMAKKDVFLDATLYVYQALHRVVPPEQAGWAVAAAEWGAQVTGVAHRHGVKITAGTDWFEPDRGELPHTHQELSLLVEQAGLSPMDAIVAGTRNGAESMGLLAERGTVATGKAADLLVLEANPLEDIRNTGKIRWVIKDGEIITPLR